MIYRGYSIEVAETEYDRWQAVIKRLDGRMIVTQTADVSASLISTPCLTSDDAIADVKALIDRGQLSAK